MRQPSFLWWRGCMRLQLRRSSFHLVQVSPLKLHIDVWSHDVVYEVSSWDLCRAKHRSRVRQRIDKDVFTSLAAAIPAVQGSYPSFSKWPPKFPQYSTRAMQA